MMKNILVVDDSALMRKVLCDIINADGTFQVSDVCRDGLEAYEKLKKNTYDAVILDLNMPKMGGLELLQRLREEKIQATVIVVSTLTTAGAEVTILAMEYGAVDFVTKPTNVIEAKGDSFRTNLLRVLLAVTTKERFVPAESFARAKAGQQVKRISAGTSRIAKASGKVVALACSTGGPKALQSVIPFLPKNLDAAVVLVQHMPVGFTKSMADRLDVISPIHVKEAEDGEELKTGTVYIAPGGKHLEVRRISSGGHKISLNSKPAIGGLRPCANLMYESLRDSSFNQIVCVVLTGMGADGTHGIISLAKAKPVYVIAQNSETCVVYGMPKAIAETGIVDEVVPLTEVAQSIIKNVGVK